MTSHVDTLDTRPKCVGLCGRPVTNQDKWCSYCWPSHRTNRVKSSEQIREEILRAAFVLRFGTTTEQTEAFDTLSHLVSTARKGLTESTT